MMAPLLHGLTAVLIACAAALGSCLLALLRGRIHTEPELRRHRFSTSPGQSLFLAFLACALASTATGLSCTSPARVEPARSSWDFGGGGGGGGGGSRPHRFFFRYSVSDSAASASTRSSAATGGSAESARSGRVHWRDAGAEELTEAEKGEGEGEGEEEAVRESPSDTAEKGWLQRYWEATGWLFGALRELARRQNGTEAASQAPGEEEDGGNAPGGNGQEAGFSRWTDV